MPKFQIQTKKTQFINAAHTELNNLGTLLELYPEKIFPIVDTVYSAQSYTSPMNSLLKSIPHSTEKVKGMTFSWKMRGRHDKPLVIVDVAPQVNVDKPGSYQSDVAIIVDENFWLPGDVIKPGPANGDIKLRIQEGPTRSGNGYKYICRSFKKDFFLQKKYLEVGTEWVKLFSQYEEGAEQSGSTYFGSDISFTTSLSKYRKGYRITDYADRAVLNVKLRNSAGQEFPTWARLVESETWLKWGTELERGLWLSSINDSGITGSTGRVVTSGPGLDEILQDAWRHKTSHLTARGLEEFLMDIWFGRTSPGSRKRIYALTGEYGMLNFSRAVKAEIQTSGWIPNFADMTLKKQSGPNSNINFGYGFQYVEYYLPNGGSVTVIHNPLFDDRNVYTEIDPLTGYPVKSQEMVFLDIVGDGNQNNVLLLEQEGSFEFAYICGLHSPYNIPTQKSKTHTAAHAGEYYEMHMSKLQGIAVRDVTRCGVYQISQN